MPKTKTKTTGWADGQQVPVSDITGQRTGAGEALARRQKRRKGKKAPPWEHIFQEAIDLQCLHPPDREAGEDEGAYAARFDAWWWALWDWRVHSRNAFSRQMREGWPAYQLVFSDLTTTSFARGYAFRADVWVFLPGTGSPGQGGRPHIWHASMRKHAHRVRPHDASLHGQRGPDLQAALRATKQARAALDARVRGIVWGWLCGERIRREQGQTQTHVPA